MQRLFFPALSQSLRHNVIVIMSTCPTGVRLPFPFHSLPQLLTPHLILQCYIQLIFLKKDKLKHVAVLLENCYWQLLSQ